MHAHEELTDGQTHWQTYWPMYFGAAGVAVVLVLVWAGLTYIVYPSGASPADAIASRGQFGDMFGLANAMFSGFAFTALIFSMHMQRGELTLQREELRLTRAELALQRAELSEARVQFARQAEALEEQSRTLDAQAATELLGARIHGQAALLNLGLQSQGNSGMTHFLVINGEPSPGQILIDATKAMRTLLKEAERAAATSQIEFTAEN